MSSTPAATAISAASPTVVSWEPGRADIGVIRSGSRSVVTRAYATSPLRLLMPGPSAGIEPTVLWSVDLGPGRQTSSPLIGPDGTIYAMGGQGRLSAISPDGRVQWTAQTGPTLKSYLKLFRK